jgi:hypothetical protein
MVPDEVAGKLRTWTAHDPASLTAALRTIGRRVPFPDLTEVRKLRVPTVIVAWAGDPMHPMRLAQRVAELASAPLARLPSAAIALNDPTAVARAFEALGGTDVAPDPT